MIYTQEQTEWLVSLFRLHLHVERRCFYCGKLLMKAPKRIWLKRGKWRRAPLPHNTLTLDHVIPRSFDGSDDKHWNLVFCCHQCNKAKSNMTLEEFRMERHGGKDVEFYFEYTLKAKGLFPKFEVQAEIEELG